MPSFVTDLIGKKVWVQHEATRNVEAVCSIHAVWLDQRTGVSAVWVLLYCPQTNNWFSTVASALGKLADQPNPDYA